MTYEYKGKRYDLIPADPDEPCTGCAFDKNLEACHASRGCNDDGAQDLILVEALPEGWTRWAGGERPVSDDTRVHVRLRGLGPYRASEVYPPSRAGDFSWDHSDDGSDIVAYRVAEEVTAEKPSNPKDTIGIKKAPLSCVPMPVVAEVGVAMLEGAAKYGRHNYRAVGVRASVYFDATMRHLVAWWEGEDTDPDSGVSHITKALAGLMVLRDAQRNGLCADDRPPVPAPFYPELNEKAAAILERHADKSPKHYTQENIGLSSSSCSRPTWR